MAGSGSAMAGSGSAMAGSGSAMAGSGSAADSGSGSAGSGSAVAAGSGSGAGSGSADTPKEEQDAFLKLSKDDKLKIMKQKVMPAMSKAFKGHDAKKFAKFNCKTCHGKGTDDKSFKMPNPDLPPLDFEALKAGKQEPKMAKFMGEVVEPDMAKILDVPKFDPAHPDKGGFGCLACHIQKK
jgi:hypothetical protein